MSPRRRKSIVPARVEWGHPLWRDEQPEDESAVPSPELVEGCCDAAVTAIRRLRVVLDRAPAGAFMRVPYMRRLAILEASVGLAYQLRAEYGERK